LYSRSYKQKVIVSFVADVSGGQNMWERSGKFEGDIMLTEEQLRNGLKKTARRWRGRTVPFYIDPVFSKYCSIKMESGMGAWRELSMHLKHRFSSEHTGR
jgi:hypothetical protein